MIWTLFIAAALLVLGVVWWLSRALSADARRAAGARHELELVRDRLLMQLNELDAERADRGIDAQVGEDEETRLSAELADVLKRLEDSRQVQDGATSAVTLNRLRRTTAVSLVILLPAVAVGLYSLHHGAMVAALMEGGGLPGPQLMNAQVPPQVIEMVGRLEKRLKDNPNDAEGWARLGRSYIVLQRMDDAEAAYAKAYALKPDDPDVLGAYAWLLFNKNPGGTEGLILELYSRLIKIEPTNADALWFMGLAAYQRGELRTTLQYWERLSNILPVEDPALQQLRHAIDKVKSEIKK